jgi:hypothetical protein
MVALLRGTPVQGFAHALGAGKVLARPSVTMPHTSVCRQRRQQQQKQRCTQTQTALVSM